MQNLDFSDAPQLDARTAETVKRRFAALNRGRFQRMQDTLSAPQQAFFDLLPLIFHSNHPLLPAYIEEGVPQGISDYQPSKTTLALAARQARSFKYQRRALPQYGILGIYLMGSAGTVAHSERSDFDIWVCRDPSLAADAVAALNTRCELLTAWGGELGLEVHFFVLTADDVRLGKLDSLSHESSGSSQNLLLRDEFYRTALLLAGRYPAWWLVPPALESDYTRVVEQLVRRGIVRDHEFIDFGGLPRIPAEEFFGATVWQLYKAIDSPYKSVLKLMLLECYAAEYPDIELLSTQFKEIIFRGDAQISQLDPYVMMMHRVESYLIRRDEPRRLELARRCFYFKVDERLTKAPLKRGLEWRRDLLEELGHEWGWDRAHLLVMDSRSSWKINRVLEERATLVHELTHSYRALSDFARRQAKEARIDPSELNVLGRRLYSAFERKAGKIELINPGISTNLSEFYLSIHESRSPDGREGWALYRGNVNPTEAAHLTPLKRTLNILEMVAWSFFNRLITRNTRIALYTRESQLRERDVEAMCDSLRHLFPRERMDDRPMADFASAARLVKTALYVNLGIDPMEKLGRDGHHLVSDRTDALAYGGMAKNLAHSFELLVANSWQELVVLRYREVGGLMDCLCEMTTMAPLSQGVPPLPKTYCFSSMRASFIAQRIETLFSDVFATFYRRDGELHRRYVVQTEQSFYVLQPEDDRLAHHYCRDYPALTEYLGQPDSDFHPLSFDRHALPNGILPVIYEYNREGVIQFFYEVRGGQVDIHVLDEAGALYVRTQPYHDTHPLLNHYALFFEAVAWRSGLAAPNVDDDLQADFMEFFHLKREGMNYHVIPLDRQQFQRSGGYFNVQVLAEAGDTGEANFTVYVEDRDFSSLQHGDSLFSAVSSYVLKRRPSGQPYPIYITDIDMSPSLLSDKPAQRVQTIHYLRHKERFEALLNTAG